MQEVLWVSGTVLKCTPSGDYDRRVVILTKEHGKVIAFARGARRQTNHLMAATDMFVTGRFKLYPGKDSYSLLDAEVKNYFEELRNDYMAALYGMYFLEVLMFHTREENDEKEKLLLLYQSLRALSNNVFDHRLVRAVLECKLIMLEGEFHRDKYGETWSAGVRHTLDFLLNTKPEKVFSFTLKEDVLKELITIAGGEMAAFHGGHSYKCEEMLNTVA